MTTAAFRVDAGDRIGLGHVMRCLALADALRARGVQTVFVTAAVPDKTAALLRARDHLVLSLAGAGQMGRGTPGSEADAARQHADASATGDALAAVGPVDWIVVDHYGLGLDWERAAVRVARHVAVIDDHARRAHDCDMLIDHNVSAAWAQYDCLVPPRTVRLVGPRYALLRQEFARSDEKPPRPRAAVSRLLVSFGGADPTGETAKTLNALAMPALDSLSVDVVVGAANPRLDVIRQRANARGGVEIHVDAQNIAGLMDAADLAIGAAGVSALERCAKGLPTLLIAVADNQEPIARALAQYSAAVYLGKAGEVDERRISQALGGLMAVPDLVRTLGENAAATCDGQGARRVAARMLSFDLRLRPAEPRDRDRVLAWRNDEATRRYSLDPAPIDPSQHAAWFAERLKDEHGALLIAEDAAGPVGVLRFDVRGTAASVSLYLVPGRYGEGLGALLLHAGHQWLKQHRPNVRVVNADVLADNRASRLAFAEAGYTPRQFVLQRSLQA